MIKLSIILPCYNVSKYISRCLDTILAIGLSKDEYEILCVDDCSTDNTMELMHSIKSQHNNLIVYSQSKNVGPGACRNLGLQKAKGEYVWFVDADDMIIPEVVPELIKMTENHRLDVLVFDYQDIDENEHPMKKAYDMKDTNVMTGGKIGDFAFEGGLVNNMGYPVRFLIKKEYLIDNNIIFPTGMTYGEDTVWMAKVVLLAERIKASSICAYQYWHHETSTCGQLNKEYPGKTIYERCILTASQLIEFVKFLKEKPGREWEVYAKEIEKYTIVHYLNHLPIMIGRTGKKERKVFYKIWSLNSNEQIKNEASILVKILLHPIFGSVAAELLAVCYKLTHKKQ